MEDEQTDYFKENQQKDRGKPHVNELKPMLRFYEQSQEQSPKANLTLPLPSRLQDKHK
jgi:hypothetical protein